VPVIRPDGSIVKGEGTHTAGWDTVAANGSGSFTYDYILNAIEGDVYRQGVQRAVGRSLFKRSAPCQYPFEDAFQEKHQQYQNGVPPSTAPAWATGAINGGKSVYCGGDSVPFRYEFSDVPAGAYIQLEIHYDFTKGGIHAYDFLTSAKFSELTISLITC